MSTNTLVVTARALLVASFCVGAIGCAGTPEGFDSETGPDEVETRSDALITSAYRVSLGTPRTLFGGRPATLSLRVLDARSRAVTTFDVEHTKLFHLIVVSKDLSYFAHIHPTYVGGGRFEVPWTPPSFDDAYHLYAQFKPAGRPLETVLLPLRVPGTSIKVPAPLVADTVNTKRSGPNVLEIDRPAQGFGVGAQTLHFMVKDAATGLVANDLGTYLGARAHIIAIKGQANGQEFLHGHDMGSPSPDGGAGGHGGMPMPMPMPATGAGHLSFDVSFAQVGTYRLWVQYNRGGQDVAQYFTVEVGGATCNYAEPGRSYVGRSAAECALVQVTCVPGLSRFDDACGCGCAATGGGAHGPH